MAFNFGNMLKTLGHNFVQNARGQMGQGSEAGLADRMLRTSQILKGGGPAAGQQPDLTELLRRFGGAPGGGQVTGADFGSMQQQGPNPDALDQAAAELIARLGGQSGLAAGPAMTRRPMTRPFGFGGR